MIAGGGIQMIKKKTKGMTLIELIISIAIIGIMIVSFSSIFIGGFKSILKSGKRSKNGMESQKQIEQLISTRPPISDDNTELEIKFYDNTCIKITGQETQVNVDDVTYTIFIPVH